MLVAAVDRLVHDYSNECVGGGDDDGRLTLFKAMTQPQTRTGLACPTTTSDSSDDSLPPLLAEWLEAPRNSRQQPMHHDNNAVLMTTDLDEFPATAAAVRHPDYANVNGCSLSTAGHRTFINSYGQEENIYEEINEIERRRVMEQVLPPPLSQLQRQQRPPTDKHCGVNCVVVLDEIDRVRCSHHSVLNSLNLDLETFLKPQSPEPFLAAAVAAPSDAASEEMRQAEQQPQQQQKNDATWSPLSFGRSSGKFRRMTAHNRSISSASMTSSLKSAAAGGDHQRQQQQQQQQQPQQFIMRSESLDLARADSMSIASRTSTGSASSACAASSIPHHHHHHHHHHHQRSSLRSLQYGIQGIVQHLMVRRSSKNKRAASFSSSFISLFVSSSFPSSSSEVQSKYKFCPTLNLYKNIFIFTEDLPRLSQSRELTQTYANSRELT